MKHETRFPYWLIENWFCWHCFDAMREVLHSPLREAWTTARDCRRT